jgi:hypothetical protein
VRTLAGYVREFFRNEHHPLFYLLNLLFLVGAIAFNYTNDFERGFTRAWAGTPRLTVWYFLFYGTPFLFTVFTWAICKKRTDLLHQGKFWALALAALLILSINGSFMGHVSLISRYVTPPLQYLTFRCANNFVSALIYAVLISVVWALYDRPRIPLYGLSRESFDYRPFLIILAIVLPLILWASFQSDFLQTYPRYRTREVADFYGISNVLPTAVFESFYGLDFVSTEFFFRGFMVLAFARFMGSGAVFPMVTVYAFLHFEKPLAEAISSVFGGLALGIISYSTRSIYGGIMVHLGVAWMMEAAAFLQLAAR